jgi:hypothetical protein
LVVPHCFGGTTEDVFFDPLLGLFQAQSAVRFLFAALHRIVWISCAPKDPIA